MKHHVAHAILIYTIYHCQIATAQTAHGIPLKRAATKITMAHAQMNTETVAHASNVTGSYPQPQQPRHPRQPQHPRRPPRRHPQLQRPQQPRLPRLPRRPRLPRCPQTHTPTVSSISCCAPTIPTSHSYGQDIITLNES